MEFESNYTNIYSTENNKINRSKQHLKTSLKYKALRRALKNYIFQFLDFTDIFGEMLFLDKEFISILKKNDYFKLFFSLNKGVKDNKDIEKENFLANHIDEENYKKYGKDLESYIILLKYKNEDLKFLNTKKFCNVYLSKETFQKHHVIALVKYLKSIETLVFQKNIKKSFKEEFIDSLSEIIKLNIDNIKTYDFSCNYIGYMNKDLVEKLLEIILSNPNLKRLNFSKNNIGKSEIKKILEKYFSENDSIEELDLSYNVFGLELEKEMNFDFCWSIIEKNKVLKILNLSSNFIGAEKTHIYGITNEFKINKTLHTLNLSNNKIADHLEGFKILLAALEENHLKTFDLSQNRIGQNKESFTEFTNFLGKIKKSTIENFNLSNNELGNLPEEEILLKFFQNLKNLNSIKYLQLDGNYSLKHDNNLFVKNLTHFVNENEIIQNLHISSNNIGFDKNNIKKLLEMLNNTNIINLNMYNSQLSFCEETVNCLCHFITHNKKVKNIDLRYNSLGERVHYFKKISEAIQNNNTLETIDLSNNNIEENNKNVDQLHKILKNNHTIKELICKIYQISNIDVDFKSNKLTPCDKRLIYE